MGRKCCSTVVGAANKTIIQKTLQEPERYGLQRSTLMLWSGPGCIHNWDNLIFLKKVEIK